MDTDKTLKELGVVQLGGRRTNGGWQVDLVMRGDDGSLSARSGHGTSYTEALEAASIEPEVKQHEVDPGSGRKSEVKTGDRPVTPKAVETEEAEPASA